MSETDNKTSRQKNNDDLDFSPDYAVALGYDKNTQNAPKVLAKGQGHVAERIVQLALDNEITIHRDADLLQILKTVDIDEEIPLEAFAAVAEIISYIYQQNGKTID